MMTTESTTLKRTLGSFRLWGIAVGLVISGEYFGWSYGWAQAGTLGFLLTSLFVAVMYTAFIFSFTELTTSIPHAGGPFAYAYRAFGPVGGYIAGFATLIEFVFAPPAIAMAIGAYLNVQFPAQTVRATVIGAGAHTLSLSGSTIWLEGVQLPLRNLPVAIPIDETDLVSAWQQALLQLDLDPKTDAYVLALPASLPVRYAAVLTVINALVDFVARFPNPHPLLVVAGQDFGKALGMLLRPQLQQLPLAVIDEVIVRAGDYIDIGTPLFGGSVVPVTVKSLAFPS